MFISFEGIEGSSKSTQTELLSEVLAERCISHIKTKEPGTPLIDICGKIRKLLLDPCNEMCDKAEFFLYLADRAEHVEKCIRPALQNNQWVISDRFMDSTLVYQGIGRELGISNINDMIEYATDRIVPDLVFIMDLPAGVGLARAKKSNREFKNGDRIEKESVLFHQRLRQGFLDVAGSSDRYVVINAERSIAEIHEEIIDTIKKGSLKI